MPNLTIPTGNSLDSTTAVASDIISGKTAYDGEGNLLTGTMANRDAWTASINPGDSVVIPAGYHNGNGKVSATMTSGSGIYASFSTTSGMAGISQLLVSDPNWLSNSNSSSCTFKKSGNVRIIGYGTVPQYTGFSISCAGQTLCSCQGTNVAASTSCDKIMYVSAGQSLSISLGWSNYGGWCRCAIIVA